MYYLGIDVGGTFTDIALMNENGETEIFKVESTPKDPRSLSENSLRIKYFTQKISSIKSMGRYSGKIMGNLLKNSPFSYECSAIYPL